MSRSPYDASPRGPHPLSLSRSARMPRSLPALIARTEAPSTPETPVLDAVLLATTASEVRRMQREMETMRQEIAKWKQRVTDLEAREKV